MGVLIVITVPHSFLEMTMKFIALLFLCITSFNLIANSWVYEKQEDGFNDQVNHIAQISGKNQTSLTVRCNENSLLDVYFFFNDYLSNQHVPVRWRIDKNKPQEGRWKVSSKGTSVFSHYEIKNILARDLTKGSKVLLEATDYRGTKHKISFPLKGSAKAIYPVLEACNIPQVKITFNNINEIVSDYIDLMGPKETVCLSKELILIGYKVSEISDKKTEELYIETQKFLDEKMKQCPSTGNYLLRRNCKKPSEFFFKLYVEAREKDKGIKAECGTLKSGS